MSRNTDCPVCGADRMEPHSPECGTVAATVSVVTGYWCDKCNDTGKKLHGYGSCTCFAGEGIRRKEAVEAAILAEREACERDAYAWADAKGFSHQLVAGLVEMFRSRGGQ